jgi:hypothetical protein
MKKTRTPEQMRADLAEIAAILSRFSISGHKLKDGVSLPQVVREFVEASESGAANMGKAMTAGFENEQRLESALKPFADFGDAFDAKPINGLDKEQIYGIHGGKYVDGGAYIGWDHIRAAQAAMKRTSE